MVSASRVRTGRCRRGGPTGWPRPATRRSGRWLPPCSAGVVACGSTTSWDSSGCGGSRPVTRPRPVLMFVMTPMPCSGSSPSRRPGPARSSSVRTWARSNRRWRRHWPGPDCSGRPSHGSNATHTVIRLRRAGGGNLRWRASPHMIFLPSPATSPASMCGYVPAAASCASRRRLNSPPGNGNGMG